MKPKKPMTGQNPHLKKAIACHRAGQLADAIGHYKKGLNSTPSNANLLTTVGALLLQTGKLEESIRINKRSVKIDPRQAIAHAHLGSAYAQLKKLIEAIECCDRALALKPDFVEVHYNRGKVLEELKRHDEAVENYDRALALKPDLTEAYYNRGNVLQELERFAEAVASYDQALALRPDYAEVYCNRGNALRELNKTDAALANYQRAIALKPGYADAYNNLGMLFLHLKQFDEAWRCFDLAIKFKPGMDLVYSLRVFCKLRICHWRDLENDLAELGMRFQAGERISEPFMTLAIYDNPALHRKVAEKWTSDRFPPILLQQGSTYPEHDRIRLAYFSADFNEHPVAYLTAELYEKHNRDRFEIIAFSIGGDTEGEMRTRLEAGFDRFIDVSELSDEEVAQLARTMEIDIAIDLGGHTAKARTGIFALRAAPIQVSYIGYLGTMGAEYMDYLIADRVIIPEETKRHYVEKIIYLPSYQANDSKRRIAETVFSRKELGLPGNGFVFCCFNNNYKISAEIFSGWMRILTKVPGSVLFLYCENELVEKNLKHEAGLRGVAADRLIVGKRLPFAEHLARYRAADLFLDTLPYNAGTTTSDALWAGLPVLTRIGESFASRVAASLLTGIGLPELITSTQEQYEALAIELATHPEQMAAIRSKLRENRLTTPLFDIQLFTAHIEAAYTRIYRRYRNNLPPEDIYV